MASSEHVLYQNLERELMSMLVSLKAEYFGWIIIEQRINLPTRADPSLNRY